MLNMTSNPTIKINYQMQTKQLFGAATLIILFITSLVIGTESITFQQLLSYITGHHTTSDFILQLRIHREATALLCGGMVGLGSAILQGITRNDMVAPDLTGMTSIACLMVVIGAYTIGKSPALTLILGVLGSAIGFLICYLLTCKRQDKNKLMLVLIGISISFAANAVTQLILLHANNELDEFLYFLSGSLYATTFQTTKLVIIMALIAIPSALILSKHFSVLYLDDQTSQSIGAPLRRLQFISFSIASLLIGSSICAIGNMGFIGIVAPNISRMFVGNRPTSLFILSFIIGAFIYLTADLIGRTIITPAEIPAGITANIIAAPLFLFILYRYFRGRHE